MLNLSFPGNTGYFIDRTTVPFTQILSGNNSIAFTNAATSLFAAKIDAGNFCVPIMWYIYNSTGNTLTQGVFKNGSGDWNSIADITGDGWTVLYPLDKVKGNHTHIGAIDQYLTLSFNSPLAAISGGLTIYTCFTAVPKTATI